MRSERGFLLPGALALLVVVSAAGVVMLARSRTLFTNASTALVSAQALQAADGGIETARAQLARDPSWAGAEVRIGTCDVTVSVVHRASGWHVIALARPGAARVEADLDPAAPGLPRTVAWRRIR